MSTKILIFQDERDVDVVFLTPKNFLKNREIHVARTELDYSIRIRNIRRSGSAAPHNN